MPERRSVLAGHATQGRFGARVEGEPGVAFSERRDLAVVQVACFPGDSAEVSKRLEKSIDVAAAEPNRASTGNGTTVLWAGPERWLVVRREAEPGDLAGLLGDAFANMPAVAVTDLSHNRSVFRLSGPRVRDLLAKGIPLDFDPSAFAPGTVAQSRFGHVVVLLHAVENSTFELYVMRSFALSLWEDLTDQAGEYGYEIA